MHELSIAMSIVEMAEEEAAKRGVQVAAVHLKLGTLSGVVKESLLFSFEIACQGTALEGARLEIEDVPVTGYCPRCRTPVRVESIQWFVCAECRAPVSEVIEGRQLEVSALELREQNDRTAALTGS
jgi:hydrogenase nickel incorporation protein HypA/HybF